MSQVSIKSSQFPTLVGPANATCKTPIRALLDHRETVAKELLRSGALLLRGFKAPSLAAFADFCAAFSGQPLRKYRGGVSPRRAIMDGVYTSTEYPETLDLSLHNEMSYTYRWPTHLFFMCVVAPKEGGETPVADSRAVLRRIHPDIVAKFCEKQIRYVRRLSPFRHDRYCWQEAFETEDSRSVEEYCAQGNACVRWQSNGGLELTETRPALATHPLTGEEVWFNQAAAFHSGGNKHSRLDAFFGDGSPLEESDLVGIRRAMLDETFLFKWHTGDVLILDNLLAAHGRRPFSGARTIVLAMT
jgi:alpha-ketoglutarate-dependent taurine dioxygenase